MAFSQRTATLSALTRGTLKMCQSAVLAPFDRPTRVSFLEAARVYHRVYLRTPQLPTVAAESIVTDRAPIQVTHYLRGKWELSLLELSIVVGLARTRQAARIFEIGTFDGRTTLNLHLNAPEAQVHTIDLPAGKAGAPEGKSPGALIRDHVAAGRIIQLWGNSLEFDFSPWFGTRDFVFVDAGHSYRNARADSQTALRLIEGREGAILWHDYGSWPGVTQAVDQVRDLVASDVSMGWLEGTSLAFLITRPGSPLRITCALNTSSRR